MAMQLKTLAALSLLHCSAALARPQIWVKTSSLPLFSGGAKALAPLRGKISTTLTLLRGVGAAPRGTATLGAAAVLPYRAESFGAFFTDDDPEEPGRALPCKEYTKAEICRVAGCKWDKPTATCDDWPLEHPKTQLPPPFAGVEATPAPSVGFAGTITADPSSTPTAAGTEKPSAEEIPAPPPEPKPSGLATVVPTPVTTGVPTPRPTQVLSTEPTDATSTTAAHEPVSATAPDEETSTSTTAEQTTTTTGQTTTTTTNTTNTTTPGPTPAPTPPALHPLCAGTKRGTTDCSKCDQVLVEREGKGDSNVTATNRSLENAFPYFNDAETCVCVVAHGSNFHENYGGEIYLTDLGDCAFIYGYNNRIHASPPRVSVIRRRVRSGETTRVGRSSQRDPPSLSRRETEATTSSRSWMGNVMRPKTLKQATVLTK